MLSSVCVSVYLLRFTCNGFTLFAENWIPFLFFELEIVFFMFATNQKLLLPLKKFHDLAEWKIKSGKNFHPFTTNDFKALGFYQGRKRPRRKKGVAFGLDGLSFFELINHLSTLCCDSKSLFMKGIYFLTKIFWGFCDLLTFKIYSIGQRSDWIMSLLLWKNILV